MSLCFLTASGALTPSSPLPCSGDDGPDLHHMIIKMNAVSD